MKIDILFNEIQKIQQDYKNLLVCVQEQFFNNVSINEIADEISIFWYGRRNIIELYLQNLPKDNSTYLFTGASYLDIQNKEHYPFITIGTHHIIDDSVSRYLQDVQ